MRQFEVSRFSEPPGIPAAHRVTMKQQGKPFALRAVRRYALLGLPLVLLADVPNTAAAPFIGARGLLFACLVSTLFLPARAALPACALVLITGQDIVSRGEGTEGFRTASIWQLELGPINPTWLVMGVLAVHVLRFNRVKLGSPVFDSPLRWAAIWFASVPLLTGIAYGGLTGEHAAIEVLVDVKFGLVLILSIAAFSLYLSQAAEGVNTLASALVGGLVARHLIDAIYALNNLGPEITTGVSRASEDSAKGAVILLIYFGLGLLAQRAHRALGVSIALVGLFLLIIYGSRMLWITFPLGLLLLMLAGRGRGTSRVLMSTLIVVAGAIWIIGTTQPNASTVLTARALTITEGRAEADFDLDVDYNVLSRIDPVRYAQTLNIWRDSHRRGAIVWGSGYGGWYSDDVVEFPATLESSFPLYSFESGKYYSAHDFFLESFLKYGIAGTAIISAIWVVPGRRLYALGRSRMSNVAPADVKRAFFIMALLPFLVTGMLQLYWSGKGLLINGIAISLVRAYVRLERPKIGGLTRPDVLRASVY